MPRGSSGKAKGQMPWRAPRVRGRRIDKPPSGNDAEGPGEEEGQGNGTTLLTGWPWGPASSISHSGAERWLSPSVTGGHAPQAALGAARQRPTTAKTRALLTGRSPSTKPAGSPKAPATLNSNATAAPLTGQVLCPGSLSPSPPHLHASASSSCLLLPPSSPRRFFFFLLQQLLKHQRGHR